MSQSLIYEVLENTKLIIYLLQDYLVYILGKYFSWKSYISSQGFYNLNWSEEKYHISYLIYHNYIEIILQIQLLQSP